MIYPARLVADSNATLLATFPDFPEAATFGADVADTLVHAQDALLTVIAARIDDAVDDGRLDGVDEQVQGRRAGQGEFLGPGAGHAGGPGAHPAYAPVEPAEGIGGAGPRGGARCF